MGEQVFDYVSESQEAQHALIYGVGTLTAVALSYLAIKACINRRNSKSASKGIEAFSYDENSEVAQPQITSDADYQDLSGQMPTSTPAVF